MSYFVCNLCLQNFILHENRAYATIGRFQCYKETLADVIGPPDLEELSSAYEHGLYGYEFKSVMEFSYVTPLVDVVQVSKFLGSCMFVKCSSHMFAIALPRCYRHD